MELKVGRKMGVKPFLIGGCIGYILGAKAGHHRYEQIVNISKKLWNSKPVQAASSKAQDAAGQAFTEAKSAVSGAVKKNNADPSEVSVEAFEF